MVEPIPLEPVSPFGRMKRFSGETEGHVLRYPLSSIRKSSKNSAASRIIG